VSDGFDDLTSPRFAGDPHLEAIFDGLELMAFGWFDCSVKKVQQALVELGFDLGPAGVDGDFRTFTHAAVQGFQAGAGLVADGVVGPVTLRALEASVPPFAAQPVDCGEGSVDTGGGLPAGATGTLSVVVFLGEQVVEGANVSARSQADPTARFGTTDSAGRHSFGTLPVGEYLVAADGGSLGTAQTTATLEEGDLHEVVIQLVRQGETRRPAAFGVRPLSATGDGFSNFISPHDPARGVFKSDREQEARDQATERALTNLNRAVEREQQSLQDAHPGLTLRFRNENFNQSCGDPQVINIISEGEGVGTVVVEEIQVTCTASVHLVFESEEELFE
jgi:Putative peptidoglycan binding domain/Carboxypeptidase regulatory-like domain